MQAVYLDGNQASLISRNIPSWPPAEEAPCRRERATVSVCRFSVSSAPVRIASPSKAPAKDQKPQFFLGAWFGNEDPEARFFFFFFLLTQTSHDSGFCNSRHRRCCQVAREATLAAESRFRASTRAATSKAEEDVCHSRRNRSCLWRSEEGVRSFGAGVTDGCELGTKPGLSKKLPVLCPTGLSLQSFRNIFRIKSSSPFSLILNTPVVEYHIKSFPF